MGGVSYCCASYCCFRKFSFANLLSQNCCSCIFPPLQKAPVIAVSQICFCKFIFAKLLLLLIAASPKDASYCCFRKAVSNNFFQKVLLISFFSIYANLLKHFVFPRFLLIENYEKCAIRKDSVIVPFVEQFKTATLIKSYW